MMTLHRGGKEIAKRDLDLIPLPRETESYKPVSHYHLADKLSMMGRDILRDYILIGEKYAIARDGNQMFAVLNFSREKNPAGDCLNLSIAFRNSYDQSMSIGIAIGATVFVCDNLALNGDIVVMKRHTKNVWDSLEETAITTLYRAQNHFGVVEDNAKHMRRLPMTDDRAFALMGMMFGHEIVSPRQLAVVRDEWLKPAHAEFQPRNAWSLFNATTEALKNSPPIAIMERHRQAYDLFSNLATANTLIEYKGEGLA